MYAIETFASTGKGYVCEDYDCSHYMRVFDASKVPLRVKSAKTLLHGIEQHFSTLAFCRRWLDDLGHSRWGFWQISGFSQQTLADGQRFSYAGLLVPASVGWTIWEHRDEHS